MQAVLRAGEVGRRTGLHRNEAVRISRRQLSTATRSINLWEVVKDFMATAVNGSFLVRKSVHPPLPGSPCLVRPSDTTYTCN